MAEHIPLADRIAAEVEAFWRLWRSKKWLAVLIAVGGIMFCLYSAYSSRIDGKQVKKLEGEKGQLEAKLRDLERKNEDLEKIVAPLLARAAKEFPGEEINNSLKKLVARLEADSPANRPLALALATVEVVIDSPASPMDEGTRDFTAGGYVALGKTNDENPLIVASAPESYRRSVGTNAVLYGGEFKLSPTSKLIGAPLKALSATEFLQLEFKAMAENKKVKSGKVTIILNGNIRLEFDVPAQVAYERKIFVRGIQNQIREALQCNQGT